VRPNLADVVAAKHEAFLDLVTFAESIVESESQYLPSKAKRVERKVTRSFPPQRKIVPVHRRRRPTSLDYGCTRREHPGSRLPPASAGSSLVSILHKVAIKGSESFRTCREESRPVQSVSMIAWAAFAGSSFARSNALWADKRRGVTRIQLTRYGARLG